MASYVVICICGLIQLYFLACTIYHREENVMKLSQVTFLITLQTASLVAIIGSAFYLPSPERTWTCYVSGPLTLIPLQLMFAIVFGRLRRIIFIMAPLMSTFDPSANNSRSNLRAGLKVWRTVMMMGRSTSTSYGSANPSSQNRNSSAVEDPSTSAAAPTATHPILSRLPSFKSVAPVSTP